ncbi:MAG: hypothetical protein J6S04_04985, partial [Clostridia bacterium]|nr:hypothetical protein [Clostridia bacterium]
DVTVHGNNALKISASNGSPNLTVPIEFLAYYFEDPSVDYIAFSAKTGFCFTNNFRRLTERPASGGGYECVAVCYEYDNSFNGITGDAWKTYYFSRNDYEVWKKYSKTSGYLISTGGVDKTDAIYVDYIRPMTQSEYMSSIYSLESGSIRLNKPEGGGGNLLMYMPHTDNTWQWCIEQATEPVAYGWDSEITTNGNRALYFIPEPGVTSTIRFNSTNVQFAKDIMKTGYYAFDLYITGGANTVFTSSLGGSFNATVINEEGWRTVYSTSSVFCTISTDTEDAYYAIDNVRSVTAQEYERAMNSFEMGTGGIRQAELQTDNTFYYYINNGKDYNQVKSSLTFAAGANGATLSNPRYSIEQKHSGTTSLAFDKTNGYMALSMHVESKNYKTLKNGFTFWIYSTVGLNGTSANNFVDGNGKKFGENGIMVPANTWTQITVEKDDINASARFLQIAGSTAGTIYIDDIEPLPYEEPFYYNSVAESEEGGVITNLTLEQSTHTAGDGVLPQSTSDYEDMSYYRFKGEYGLDDYLVFDFTGNAMPILSFFNTEVNSTIYNQEQDETVKGWIVTNTMLMNTGLPAGGYTSAHANRISLIGPYKISYKYDDNGSGQKLTQVRTSIYKDTSGKNEPNPASMAQLDINDQYRVIVGWVENGTNMNLRMVVWNLTEGVKIADYNQGGVLKADWEGDIALYGHFGMETKVDKVYPIVSGWENALAQYTPEMLSYNATWDGNGVTLAASTYTGHVSYPTTADMSYIAFNGKYGSGDYVVFDMTGSNMPIVSFFNNTITNTIYNNEGTGETATVKDTGVTGWVLANGLYQNDGSMYGGATGAHASRLAIIGKQKVIGYDQNTNGFRTNLGSASDVHPLSIRTLATVTDTYRVIIGIRQNNVSSVYVDMYALNMNTGKQVYKNNWYVGTGISAEGSIILYGQFGKTTVLDTVFGIEENTTLDALIAKYTKDFDYSDEEAVELDRYGYSSITDGTYTVDDTVYHSSDGSACSGADCTSAAHIDPRKDQATYNTYAAAGFNILFPQSGFGVDNQENWDRTKTYMDMAANAGLKVILHDWHISVLSTPLKAGDGAIVAADSTYKPWVLASDVNADGTGKTQVVQDYLDALALYGLTADTTRFKDQNALDSYLMNEMSRYKNHPAFYGVMLGDEPTYANAYCYGMVYNSLKRIMPEIYVQYNLLPLENNLSTVKYRYPGLKSQSSSGWTDAKAETAYKNYVTRFLDAMNTDYIQYDDYPFKSKREIVDYKYGVVPVYGDVPYIDTPALRCIQLIAEIAKERDLTVKVVTQTSLMENNGNLHIRKITEEDARWLNNYLLGFGVKQINYFTYWTKAANSTEGEYFEDGGSFVNHDGTTTEIYNFMQAIMADNDTFAPTISQFDYSDSHVYGSNNDSDLNNDHISFSSSLTDTNYSFKYLTNVTTTKEFTLVTELYDAEKYNYMYMIMNTIDPYYGGTQNVTVTLDSSVTAFYVYDQEGNRTLVSGNSYTASLTAGQAIYIMPCQFA